MQSLYRAADAHAYQNRDTPKRISQSSRVGILPLILVFATILVLPRTLAAQDSPDANPEQYDKDYRPMELQPADPEIKSAVDSARKLSEQGEYERAIHMLEKAHELCLSKRLRNDRAVVENLFARLEMLKGDISNAKSYLLSAEDLASDAGNPALEASILAGLSDLAKVSQETKESLDLMDRALDLAGQSKNLWIQAYCLGEKAQLQLSAGQTKDVRANLEEALRIDQLNHYELETRHSLYMAWLLFLSDKDPTEGMDWANRARESAIRAEDFTEYIQSSTTQARALTQSGKLAQGLALLEQTRKGVTDQGAAVFPHPMAYQKFVSFSINQVALLEAEAACYEIVKQDEDARRIWMDIYSLGTASHLSLATAEGAHGVADAYQREKDMGDAVQWYGAAVEAWEKAGNRERQMDAMASRVFVLSQNDQQKEAISEEQKLFLTAQENKDVRREFIYQLSLAELCKPAGDQDLYKKALLGAESLLSDSLTVPRVEPSLTAELFGRLAEMYGTEGRELDQLIALEKQMAVAGLKQKSALVLGIDKEVGAHVEHAHLLEGAEAAYKKSDLAKALVLFELVQKFQEYDAALNGKTYNENLDDPIMDKLADIAFRLGAQTSGPEILEVNRHDMGPLASMIWFPSNVILTTYYTNQNQPDQVIHYASQAWPYLNLKAADRPGKNDVLVACDFSLALFVKGELDDAMQKVGGCLSSAEAFGDPDLLTAAHNLNVVILGRAGKAELAQRSVEYLRDHPLRNVPGLLAVAQGQRQAGDWKGLLATLESALRLSEASSGNEAQTAGLHLQISGVIGAGLAKDELGQEGHLRKAEALYEKLGDKQSRANTLLELAAYSLQQRDWKQMDATLQMAVQLVGRHSEQDARAQLLSGDQFRAVANFQQALMTYREAARLYDGLGDKAKESEALCNVARVLGGNLNKPRDALDAVKQGSQLAEQSGNWGERVDALRLLGSVDEGLGDYRGALAALRDALSVSHREGTPLISASIELEICDALIDVGEWDEALGSANQAFPVLRQSGNHDQLFNAYITLINIYSARESSLQDFDKALAYAKQVENFLRPLSESEEAALALNLFEIHFQQGNFNQAISDARSAFSFLKDTKDPEGQANALLSLAEALWSSEDVMGAAKAVAEATPLVQRAGDFYLSGRLKYAEANLYKREGKLDLAADAYQQVIGLLEGFKARSSGALQGSASETYDYIYDELIDTYSLRGQKTAQYQNTAADKAFEIAELNKSRMFTATWGSSLIEAQREKLPADLQEEERVLDERRATLESELSQQSAAVGRSKEQIDAELGKLAGEEKAFQQKLRISFPVYAGLRYPRRMAISDLPLRPGEVLVEFKMFKPALFVWVVQGTESGPRLISFYKVHEPEEWFKSRILDIRDAMNRGDLEGFDPQASEDLFNALFPGKTADLLRSASSLIFIPDDVLSLLPFEILSPKATQNKFLLMDTPTSYFASGAGLRLTRLTRVSDRRWGSSFFGIADPVTSKADDRYKLAADPAAKDVPEVSREAFFTARGYYFERLPETAHEVNNIAGLFSQGSVTVRMGMEATKEALLQTDLSQYRFLHFATHGFLPVEGGEMEPALVLSYRGDDQEQMMLRISEIAQLKIRSDMVVLSACNTGSGKVTHADGVLSMGSAFLSAGSSSVVVSMWKVADKTTATLMEQFYRNLLSGMPKNKALAEARTQLFLAGKTQPFYWAPFVLSGE